MEKGETSVGGPRSVHRPLCGLLTGIIVLSGLVGAGAVLAAPCSDVLCDNVTRALRGLEANPDHAKNPPSAVSGARTESSAPLLYLTPRVTSILEHVFGPDVLGNRREAGKLDPDIPDRTADTARPAPTVNGKTPLPKSPVAGTGGTANAPGRYIPLPSALGDVSLLPKLQRQMYRTDI